MVFSFFIISFVKYRISSSIHHSIQYQYHFFTIVIVSIFLLNSYSCIFSGHMLFLNSKKYYVFICSSNWLKKLESFFSFYTCTDVEKYVWYELIFKIRIYSFIISFYVPLLVGWCFILTTSSIFRIFRFLYGRIFCSFFNEKFHLWNKW